MLAAAALKVSSNLDLRNAVTAAKEPILPRLSLGPVGYWL